MVALLVIVHPVLTPLAAYVLTVACIATVAALVSLSIFRLVGEASRV